MYFSFPKDPNIREQWINVTGRKDWIPTKTSTIRSEHFKEHDFDIKNSGNRYLKPETAPCTDIVYIHTEKPLNTEDTVPPVNSKLTTVPNSIPTSIKGEDIKQDLMSVSNTITPRERELQSIIDTKEYIIKKQKLQIKRIQAQNRRLKKKIIRIEDLVHSIQEKFCWNNEDNM